MSYRRLVRPVLFRAYRGDAERVHEQTLAWLSRLGRTPVLRVPTASLLARHRRPVSVAGIDFAGPVGVAAGLDKNGVATPAWAALGFGFAELGTVTARPQPGNDRPRLFRLPRSGAIVNRMGFNNHGAAALAARLDSAGIRRGNQRVGLTVGVSIGKSKATPLAEATEDYLRSLRLLSPYADYVAVNVSSPNTPGLRTLQDADTLVGLLAALTAESTRLAGTGSTPVPLFVKLAPDLTYDALEQVVDVTEQAGADGLIATNTTVSRIGIDPGEASVATEPGGLSGAPLTIRAREVVAFLADRTRLPVIGVGGVMTADDGVALVDAGARLVQLYTGFIYGGPGLIGALNARLERKIR
ncbi:MAG: quinone-dependent dihydroorotate dehydrogenase [Microlunatus sp.]|nr:quinone-dependent dihydroorotate dehydrogenase [Microlunatus sp.]MDN5770268.1 quinone-dependent dihydroorotate dehydrogenase [Microlunatus sp.]MDN5803963.1 quinone-dependent dihydroorotate dehydrogenase [Microlunatus sp.]